MILFLNKLPLYTILSEDYNIFNINLEKFVLNSNKSDSSLLIDSKINIEGTRIQYGENDKWTKWLDTNNKNVQILNQRDFWIYVLKMSPINNYIEYSSSNTRIVNSETIKKYPISFYKNILYRIENENSSLLTHLDKAWDTLFK